MTKEDSNIGPETNGPTAPTAPKKNQCPMAKCPISWWTSYVMADKFQLRLQGGRKHDAKSQTEMFYSKSFGIIFLWPAFRGVQITVRFLS